MPKKMKAVPLPETVEVNFAGKTLTLDIMYGTAVRGKDGTLWDYEYMWEKGDALTPDQAWEETLKNFEAYKDPADFDLTLEIVWCLVAPGEATWAPLPDLRSN